MRVSRRGLDFYWHFGVLALFVGAFSVVGNFARVGMESLGTLGCVLLAWLLGFCGIWLVRRPPLVGLVLLGMLPVAHLLVFIVLDLSTRGSFTYLYKFAPFVLAPYLWWWVVTRDDSVIERILFVLGAIVAGRALMTFAVPALAEILPQTAADDFIVYEWVSGLPRVFYPGMALVFFNLVLSLQRVFSRETRSVNVEVVKSVVFLAALLVTMTRGMVAIAVLLALVLIVWKLASTRVARTRKAHLVMGATLVLFTAATVVALTPVGGIVTAAGQQLLSSDRFTLSTRNIDWRVRQVNSAFALIDSDMERLLGVGTNTFVVGNPENPNPWEVVNDLHYSYHSVLWTFGVVGLGLLVVFGIVQPLFRMCTARPRGTLVVPFACTTVFIAAVGGYTIAFTSPDWNLMITLSAAYLNARVMAPRRRAGGSAFSEARPLLPERPQT